MSKEIFRAVRVHDEGEVAAFRDFLVAAYASDQELGIDYAACQATLEDVRQHFVGNLCYVLEVEGKIVASASLRMPWGPNPGPTKYPHLGWFSTHPAYKGKGYGKKMLIWLEEEILKKELKAPCLTLGTAAEHPWIVEMYNKFGYEVFGEKRMPGKQHTTILLRKHFTW